MPGVGELLDLITRQAADAGHDLPEPLRKELEHTIRRTWPGERVYIAPATSRKDPGRVQAIRHAAKYLPVKVVAQRHGVTPAWVYRVIKRK